MVIYGNIKVKESATEVYGDMKVIKRPYFRLVPWKSYTVPEYGHSMEKHARVLSDDDNVF